MARRPILQHQWISESMSASCVILTNDIVGYLKVTWFKFAAISLVDFKSHDSLVQSHWSHLSHVTRANNPIGQSISHPAALSSPSVEWWTTGSAAASLDKKWTWPWPFEAAGIGDFPVTDSGIGLGDEAGEKRETDARSSDKFSRLWLRRPESTADSVFDSRPPSFLNSRPSSNSNPDNPESESGPPLMPRPWIRHRWILPGSKNIDCKLALGWRTKKFTA